MRVLVLHNQPVLPPDHPHADSEGGVLATVEAATASLREHGFAPEVMATGPELDLLRDRLRTQPPAVVLNLFEGFPGDPQSDTRVARLLEQSGVPFTGSGPAAMKLSTDKTLLRERLRAGGAPVADGFVVRRLPVPDHALDGPLIVKPALHHASEGITQNSVVTTRAALEAQVAAVLDTFGPPVLVERLITGREFLVAVTELPHMQTLPLLEWRYVPDGTPRWPIATYDAKWHPGTVDYEGLHVDYPARDVSPALADRLTGLAIQAYRLLGCRDYARVDMRVTPEGEPIVLEVNANPDLGPTACLAGALIAADIPYATFIANLVRTAAARHPEPEKGTERIIQESEAPWRIC